MHQSCIHLQKLSELLWFGEQMGNYQIEIN